MVAFGALAAIMLLTIFLGRKTPHTSTGQGDPSDYKEDTTE